jgi:uncharacterized protein (DUF433 family)
MQHIKDLITISPEILGSQPVFKDTRVPVETLFDYLESGETLDSFLENFPTVSRDRAMAILVIASKLMSSQKIIDLYEAAA